VALLRELRATNTGLVHHLPDLRICHLFHDREEFTLVGEVA
jgi:23S rRNA (cytidine2498-2'-O)-methyltransferase